MLPSADGQLTLILLTAIATSASVARECSPPLMRRSDCANVEISGMVVTRRVHTAHAAQREASTDAGAARAIVVSVRSSTYCCRSATAPGERASGGADSKSC
eukprot:853145-Prymnesium_polylepis.2